MWCSMNEKIWFYNQLSQEEQSEVEQHVEKHPELMPLLEEAKALGPLLQENGVLPTDPRVDEALAYFIATKGASPHRLPGSLQWAFDRIEERLAADPELRLRYEEIARRLKTLEAASDPVQQFERLSGLRLPRLAPTHRRQLVVHEDTSVALPGVDGISSDGTPALRQSVSLRAVWRCAAIMVGVVAFCFVCYGALMLLSNATESDLEHLAASAPLSVMADQISLRGDVSETREARQEQDVARAYSLFQAAHTDIYGLFLRYDQTTVAEAARLVRAVLDEAEVPPVIYEEAAYLLARVRLAQGDEAGARAMLGPLVSDGRYNVEQARTLLHELDGLASR